MQCFPIPADAATTASPIGHRFSVQASIIAARGHRSGDLAFPARDELITEQIAAVARLPIVEVFDDPVADHQRCASLREQVPGSRQATDEGERMGPSGSRAMPPTVATMTSSGCGDAVASLPCCQAQGGRRRGKARCALADRIAAAANMAR